MVRKAASMVLLIQLLVSVLTFALNIQPVKASGTIYIRADGSIDPSTAPIQRVGNIYTFTSSIYDNSIVIERNSIILDGNGFPLEGTGTGMGIELSSRSDITLKNMEIKAFGHGIYLYESSNNIISGNNIMDNTWDGVVLMASSNNIVLKNDIIGNEGGIHGWASSYNTISKNLIAENRHYGIILYNYSSTYNTVTANVIAYNEIGLWLIGYNNIVYHNDFIDNTDQCLDWGLFNTWDNGYPSGGNYWSDYEGRYPDAKELDGSGIWDTPYEIGQNNQDNYPLMNPWTPTTPDFSISVSPAYWTRAPGKSTTYTVTVTSINGFSSKVSLSSSISPGSKRVSATFDRSSVTPPPDGSAKSTLTVCAAKSTKSGFYVITIRGSGEGETHSTTVTLAIALYELFFEIDYMKNHKPMDSVLTYIRNYYIKEDICVTFIVDDEIPEDPSVTESEFWSIERGYNKRGDDWASGKETGVYDSKWKWVLFGTIYEEYPLWNGFCFVPEYGGIWVPYLSDRFGNYIFIADQRNEEYAHQNSGDGVTPEGVEKSSFMHEMGHSIGILKLVFNLGWPPFVEGYDKDMESVMSEMNPKSCIADPIHYSKKYWLMKNIGYYRV